jgi:hypothetical protein
VAQARILEPQDSPLKEKFINLGFRWCNKDKRFEKTCKNPTALLTDIQQSFPNIKVEASK